MWRILDEIADEWLICTWFYPQAPMLNCRDVEMQRRRRRRRVRGDKDKDRERRCSRVQSPQKASKTSGAPCTHHCTLHRGPKKRKSQAPKKRLKAKNLLSILCPDEVLGLICQNQSFNRWEQLTRNYCENHIIEYMAPHACKKKGLPHFGDNGDQTSLLHPGPSPPVTLSKPTAFLGHYPRRGRPYPA